jgi:hypothetical protein
MLLFVAAENDATSLHEILRAGEELLGEPVGADVFAPALAAVMPRQPGTDLGCRWEWDEVRGMDRRNT